MIDEKEKRKRKADEARQLLENDLLREAFSVMEKACYNQIESSSHDEAAKREDAYLFMRCIKVFRNSLKRIINDGADVEQAQRIINELKR